ncbi:Putative zinc-finger [Desulfotomaculum arcticum]|uniref:Anti-sigma-W factor RsiW n=1 Tax=Desulfotruncus arcticus DSM 17038 TaxID=1121424 RepID=A0A1I2YJ18_9FIRM|nr:zf-HC2 domain-containing protein [Desulfotruncus arcticus]SFH25582.1 Putative zinc-finger [Desulfotomaculum arcticum] [Desulfotruncus arcticus DSM 17038]
MIDRECEIIKDLLPLYADGVASAATLKMVEQHLAQCAGCRELLEMYRQPALPVLAADKASCRSGMGGFWARLRRVAVVFMAGLIITGSTIAWASYQAGRNLALRDPSFRQAEQMDLFTEVNQSQKLGTNSITVNKILLDSARTTVFYSVLPGLDGDDNININMVDDKGVQYDLRGGRGLHGKYFICDLDPVNLDTEKITLSFSTGQMPGEARFEIPVDPTIVAQNTRELYPNLKTKVGPVELVVDRAVLGLSESIIFFRARWSQDPSIAGVGIGLDRPMFTVMGPNGPSSAESRVSFTPPEPMIKEYGAFLSGSWADLIDVTNGKRIKLNETRTQTDSITGGIEGSFHFDPVDPSARELKLTSPPLYLYRFPEKEQLLKINNLPRQGEQALNGVLRSGTVTFALERAAAEDNQLALYFKFSGGENKPPFYYRPDFQIKDKEFWQGYIRLEWLDEQNIKVTFPQPEIDQVILKLSSVGEKLPKVDFQLDAAR